MTQDYSFQARYLADLLDALCAKAAPAAQERLRSRLGPTLGHRFGSARASVGPNETLPLAEAEQLLLSADEILGAGSGQVLERAVANVMARYLAFEASIHHSGPLEEQLERLRPTIERPFLDAPLCFDLVPMPWGVRLSVGVRGRPKTTRLLAHHWIGAVQAVGRFAVGLDEQELRTYLEFFGDRARVDLRLRARAVSEPPPSAPVIGSLPSSTSLRVARRSLSEEITGILGSRDPELRRSARPYSLGPNSSALAMAQLRRDSDRDRVVRSTPPLPPGEDQPVPSTRGSLSPSSRRASTIPPPPPAADSEDDD